MEVRSVACIASHSALDVFDGAKDEGFRTIALCQVGRTRIYSAAKETVDECITLQRYSELIKDEVQSLLSEKKAVIVPNRSMAVYVGYDKIERELSVPVFGNKRMLRWEERVGEKNYYRLLDEAGIRRPRVMKLEEVDGPVMVKLQEAARFQERAFIIAADKNDLKEKLEVMESRGLIDVRSLDSAVAEELVIGAHFNINYFYSIVRRRLEIISIDRRIQSNLDGLLHLLAEDQLRIRAPLRMIEVGHVPVSIRESLLEEAMELGEGFVKASAKLEPPGIIGPFTLQVMVTPDLKMTVYDVSTRIGGGTNAQMGIGGQYSKLFLRRTVSMGRRICIEIREALEQGKIEEVVT